MDEIYKQILEKIKVNFNPYGLTKAAMGNNDFIYKDEKHSIEFTSHSYEDNFYLKSKKYYLSVSESLAKEYYDFFRNSYYPTLRFVKQDFSEKIGLEILKSFKDET